MSAAVPSPPVNASATRRGLVSTLAQSFQGIKTFVSAVILSAGLQINGVLASSSNYLATMQATFVGSSLTGTSELRFGHGNLATIPAPTLDIRSSSGKAISISVGSVNVGVYFDDTAGFALRRMSRANIDAGGSVTFTNVMYVDPDGSRTRFYNTLNTNSANTWDTAQRGGVGTLTSSGASIAIDLATKNNFSHTLTENTTLAAPSNPTAGQSGVIVFTNHASSAKTLEFASFWKFAGGTVPSLTATAGAVDTFVYYVESSGRATCNLIKDVK